MVRVKKRRHGKGNLHLFLLDTACLSLSSLFSLLSLPLLCLHPAGRPALMMRSKPVSSLQKTYDECYLVCSTAVYFEGQVRLC